MEGVDRAGRARKGDWIQTHSGVMFWPLDPRADEVVIEDIAHALSMQCRFGGHSNRFYSVAEHSLLVSSLLPPALRLWGLLHDAAEAYVIDLPRPLKRCLPGYCEIEDRVLAAVAERFGLALPMPAAVKAADEAMLMAEAGQVLAVEPKGWVEFDQGWRPADRCIHFWTPPYAEREFLAAFHAILRMEGAA